MVFDDLFEDVLEREDKPGKRRRYEDDKSRKHRRDEEDDEGDVDQKGKKKGFFDRISELFD